MGHVDFSSGLSPHARDIWQSFAEQAGMSGTAWLTRAIFTQAVHDAAVRGEDQLSDEADAFLADVSGSASGDAGPGR